MGFPGANRWTLSAVSSLGLGGGLRNRGPTLFLSLSLSLGKSLKRGLTTRGQAWCGDASGVGAGVGATPGLIHPGILRQVVHATNKLML